MTCGNPGKMKPEKFLADTSVWIKFLRGSDISLRDTLASLTFEDRLFTCDIIILEILRGARSKKEFKMLREDFLALPQLAMTRAVWEASWKNAHLLRKKGVNTPLIDILIATAALESGCTLMHSDRHFPMIAAHTGLKTAEL
jgi:predicted nucleic acid-binding protein